MKTFKVILPITIGYIALFNLVINYQSVSNYFNRFPIPGFEQILTKNRDILEKMNIEEISFSTYNYSGNSAGKQALSLTVYGTPNYDKIYLRGNSIKLTGMKAILDNGQWAVYGTESIKDYDKEEIKLLFDALVTTYMETIEKNYLNTLQWTAKP